MPFIWTLEILLGTLHTGSFHDNMTFTMTKLPTIQNTHTTRQAPLIAVGNVDSEV